MMERQVSVGTAQTESSKAKRPRTAPPLLQQQNRDIRTLFSAPPSGSSKGETEE
ncbi:hypothetical protein BGZ50_009807, partial [Haplosporangium sp. Z 11]